MDKMLFIGVGNMGSAILEQVVGHRVLPLECVWAFDTDSAKLEAVRKLNIRILSSLAEAPGCDAILLAVKPKDIPGVCAGISDRLAKDGLVISIAAGVTIASIEAAIGRPVAVCRVMPNINLLSGSGMSAVSFNSSVKVEQKKFVMNLFSATGDVLEVDESKLNAVTGLSGSGPAFAAFFISALTDGGMKSGLTNAEAYKLALQTVRGTAEILDKFSILPEKLINMVSSPGGTTIEGLHSLEKNHFRTAVIGAVEAATKKSALLGKTGKKK